MNITELYNSIIERLTEFGYKEIVMDLENLISVAATGGEGLSATGKYLLDLRQKDPSAYDLIKDQIREYLEYCKQSGLIIK